MAQRKGNQKPAKRPRATWAGFLNYNPTEEDKASYKAFTKDGYDYEKLLTQVLQSGYRMSVTWDDYGDCWTATLYAQFADMAYAGYNLSARASDPVSAQVRLVWVHLFCLGGDWETIAQSSGGDDW